MSLGDAEKKYVIFFTLDGKSLAFIVHDDRMCEPHVWLHLARHLSINILDMSGGTMAYHSIRHAVENIGVTDVRYEEVGSPESNDSLNSSR